MECKWPVESQKQEENIQLNNQFLFSIFKILIHFYKLQFYFSLKQCILTFIIHIPIKILKPKIQNKI